MYIQHAVDGEVQVLEASADGHWLLRFSQDGWAYIKGSVFGVAALWVADVLRFSLWVSTDRLHILDTGCSTDQSVDTHSRLSLLHYTRCWMLQHVL